MYLKLVVQMCVQPSSRSTSYVGVDKSLNLMLTLRLEWLASIAGLQLELLQCCMSQLLSVGVHRSKGHRLFIRHRYWRALHRYGRVLHRLLTRRCKARSR